MVVEVKHSEGENHILKGKGTLLPKSGFVLDKKFHRNVDID